jgi:hypothetical protein
MDVVYEIGPDDILRSVGGDWASFARANGAPELLDNIVGRSLWDFVAGVTTRDVYGRLIERARAGRELSFHLRCDSPDERRFMRMRMVPAANQGVRFETRLLTRAEWPGSLPFSRLDSMKTLLTVCGWCGRAQIDRQWEEPEVAVERLGIFVGTHTPAISHGICPACTVVFEETLLDV